MLYPKSGSSDVGRVVGSRVSGKARPLLRTYRYAEGYRLDLEQAANEAENIYSLTRLGPCGTCWEIDETICGKEVIE